MDQESREHMADMAGLHRNQRLKGEMGSSWAGEVGGGLRSVGGVIGTSDPCQGILHPTVRKQKA